MVYANGDIYEGYWREGKKEEYGLYIWSSADIYEGEFRNDKRTGKGVI